MGDGALIGGLCGGFGAVLLGVGIGICIVCNAKHKANYQTQHGFNRGTDQFYGVDNWNNIQATVTRHAPFYRNLNLPPAPYVPREPTTTATRYPGQASLIQTTHDASSSQQPAHRTQEPELSPDREPPSYNSIWSTNSRTNDTSLPIRHPQCEAAPALTAIEQGPPVPSPDTNAEYQPPPPEYEMTVEYPDLYKVTDREPKFV